MSVLDSRDDFSGSQRDLYAEFMETNWTVHREALRKLEKEEKAERRRQRGFSVAVFFLLVFGLAFGISCIPSPDADREYYWVRSSDTVRRIVAHHVSRGGPVDAVMEALQAMAPEELRAVGFPTGDLSRILMGHRIDSLALKNFVARQHGAVAVRQPSEEDGDYYMLRSGDTWTSILRRLAPDVETERVLDLLSVLPRDQLRQVGIPGRLDEIRPGDEINVVHLRQFLEDQIR